jgi:hypothetical protein
MRSAHIVTAVGAATALAATTGSALAATVHPTFGAKLSGMGQHGAVNFTSHASEGRLCWTFDVMTQGIITASIRDGSGMVVAKLGPAYKAKSCSMVPKSTLAMIEAKPGSYRVWVDTKDHMGELTGRLAAGMMHASVM